MSLADDVLFRLLKRGESASLRASGRAIRERFQAPASGYWRLSLDQRDHCHERLRAAEKAGGIELKWAGQGGDDRPIELVQLHDTERLAAFLGVNSMAAAVASAAEVLAPWRKRILRVDELLDRWSHLKNVRGLSTVAATEFADALRVMDSLEERQGEDQIVRTLSAQLFGDSKRIEQLERHLDVLTGESITSPARHWSEVFGRLGLVKEPQPFLVAGTGALELVGGEVCPIVRPFVGVSNKAVLGYKGSPCWVLTIENLTTFHAASQLLDGRGALILYTAGMPSPTWTSAYSRILASLPESVLTYHWGDIDVGGFRIAAYIKQKCIGSRRFRPWLMDASRLVSVARGAPEAESTRALMAKHAASAGWASLSESMMPVCIEQEQIKVAVPGLE
ncbi:Wadjet anti-phage system protein JetD domain-containing protein [Lysobacter sp. Root604]|uniref:Wadjet anti-phage system protein JetD domain-containing protein n=1 Tax=Lysobacter sp. Root604 TaxID=1736568 RepID=UPI0007017B0E|nr:Wadjet anti-phage system protein JetD domain-containing protein [Lysobacter sp. Root604]KRA17515.1 hypothetical protein ASD69_12585 [Lysobacter sp. Root604]